MFNEEQEIWKVYPDYSFIEVSNLGRVRTKDRTITDENGRKLHIKGRVLKQQPQKGGYMYVSFSMNGKRVVLRVHRMVATCFIANPNGYPEVNHKDNDPTNNTVSNLEWCTHEYNIDYREKYGMSAAEAFGRRVFAVNLETGKVLRFETQCEAARQLGVERGNISAVVRGQRIQAGGYWFTEDESEITEEKIQEIRAKMHLLCGVIAINIETSEVFWFESQSEASRQLEVNRRHIWSVVKGKRNKAGGYWFCYVDEDVVEKTREKFGDEIAEKVARLMNENNN